jgi:hypothetical protein
VPIAVPAKLYALQDLMFSKRSRILKDFGASLKNSWHKERKYLEYLEYLE